MEKFKKVLKNVLSKLPIFIFCVLFINFHNWLFGTQNSIVGVTLLIGIFMFMRGDLGFNAKQAAICIPLLFAIVAFAPKLASLNPIIGLFVNLIAISLIMIISSHDITMSNHVPFMMGYLFCQGYDVVGDDYWLRVISLVGGGILIAGLYYLVNRKKTYKRSFADLFKEINMNSTRTQWYIRLVITLSLVIFIGEIIGYPRTMWVSLAVLSLTTPFGTEHSDRAKVRIPAAILGVAVFYILFEIIIPVDYQEIVVMLAGFMSMFMANYFVKSIYNSFSSLGAAVLLFPVKDALVLRIASNVIGTLIAIGSYLLFNLIFKLISRKQEKITA